MFLLLQERLKAIKCLLSFINYEKSNVIGFTSISAIHILIFMKNKDDRYQIIKLREKPELKDKAANWFHDKWGIPAEAYLASMDASLSGDKIQEWYLCLDKEKIIAGMGEIENDFHDRKDLTPNICAVYTEPEYRCKGIAGELLNYVVEDNRKRGIMPLYLITDHIGFYEKYGWEFLCMVQGESESEMSRMYIHQ